MRMKQLILALLLSTVISNVYTSAQFDFGLFENFVTNEENFVKDVKLVQELKLLRDWFSAKRSRLLSKAATAQNATKVSSETFDTLDKEFGNYKDFDGSLRGLVILIDTYGLNLTSLGAGQVLSDKTQLEGLKRSLHSLSHFDFMDLARAAFEMGWYDRAADLVGLIQDLPTRPDERNSDGYQDTLFNKNLRYLQTNIPHAHNDLLKKRRKVAGDGFKVHPFIIDDKMKRKKKQPKFVKEIDFFKRNASDFDEISDGPAKENSFRRICGGYLKGEEVKKQGPQKCYLLHHDDPYLKLGPFKMEILLQRPFRMIFQDILTEKEIRWMIEYSRPRLSRHRKPDRTLKLTNSEKWAGKVTRVIHKTVQCWIQDRKFKEEIGYTPDMEPLPLTDPYTFSIVDPIMYKLAKKISLATRMQTQGRFSSTDFQVTNYGLGGLCETHIDPHGYGEGRQLTWDQRSLKLTGDMLGTFMAWLNDVDAGGFTAFDRPGYEQLVEGRRGSAAFWIDLDRKMYREIRSSHGGCPVLGGSKWILNKWLFGYDQVQEWRCGLKKKDTFEGFAKYY